MQLSQMEKTFPKSFFAFSKFRFSSQHFQKKKITVIADMFLNFRTLKSVVREMSKKSLFRGPFNKLHGKPTETLLKSERQHLYHIY